MEGSSSVDTDLGAPPESWEVADLDASVRRLMLTSSKDSSSAVNNNKAHLNSSSSSSNSNSNSSNQQAEFGDSSISRSAISRSSSLGVSDDLINSVDQFLREALQNPRERVSVLRIEQDVEKFMRDKSRQQMEFQQLPTSYLRLAAHRIAQHYSLSSMVILDNDQPDGTGSRIIVNKTSNSRMPLIRLADIPVSLPSEDTSSIVKVAIKQRPQKGSLAGGGSNSQLSKSNSLKSVEERKDEYNKARARIFNSNSSNSVVGGKADKDSERRAQECLQQFSRASSMENNSTPGGAPDPLIVRGGSVDATIGSSSSSRAAKARAEKELVGAPKVGNKVAIFRDRETERKDPDYDRSYDRYVQRFDPGFGFNGGNYAVQPLYAPAVDYNTEFPQLGSPAQRSPIPNEHHLRQLPHHQPGHWSAPSTPRIVYGPPETMMSTYSPGHIGSRPNSAMFLSSQYPNQHAGVPFMVQQEHPYQYFTQSSQQQHDATYGFARPR